jgi:hypothetical protein
VVNELTKRDHEAIGVDIDQLDITDQVMVEKDNKRHWAGCCYSLCGLDSGGCC